jgi:hypothetical protein
MRSARSRSGSFAWPWGQMHHWLPGANHGCTKGTLPDLFRCRGLRLQTARTAAAPCPDAAAAAAANARSKLPRRCRPDDAVLVMCAVGSRTSFAREPRATSSPSHLYRPYGREKHPLLFVLGQWWLCRPWWVSSPLRFKRADAVLQMTRFHPSRARIVGKLCGVPTATSCAMQTGSVPSASNSLA